MRRLISVTLIILILMSLCTNVFAAGPGVDLTIMYWALEDGGKTTFIEVIQFPKIKVTEGYYGNDKTAVDEPALEEVILQMDLSLSEKYLNLIENGGSIPELVLIGVNRSDRPVFKISLENCRISGFTLADLGIYSLITNAKAVIKLKVEKVTTTKLNTPEGPRQIVFAKKLNIGKLYLNGAECTEYVTLSNIEGESMMPGNGGVLYNSSELIIDYNEIGTLPDWLAEFDGTMNYNINPKCKLRYELSGLNTGDKFAFEADLKVIGQEFAGVEIIKRMFSKYTFRVDNVDFGAPAAIAGTPAAPVEPAPAEPTNLIIKQPDFRRAVEHTWAGKWVTTFGKMILKQDGTKVTGEYGNPIETLEGTASGSKLTGTWHGSFSSGKFEFTMAPDGKSFKGTMYNQTLGDRGTFEWNGDRE